jgi:hypothetical protein
MVSGLLAMAVKTRSWRSARDSGPRLSVAFLGKAHGRRRRHLTFCRAFKDWPQVFSDALYAKVIAERLVEHAEHFVLEKFPASFLAVRRLQESEPELSKETPPCKQVNASTVIPLRRAARWRSSPTAVRPRPNGLAAAPRRPRTAGAGANRKRRVGRERRCRRGGPLRRARTLLACGAVGRRLLRRKRLQRFIAPARLLGAGPGVRTRQRGLRAGLWQPPGYRRDSPRRVRARPRQWRGLRLLARRAPGGARGARRRRRHDTGHDREGARQRTRSGRRERRVPARGD